MTRVIVAVSVLALAIAGIGYHEHQALRASRAQLIASTLDPIIAAMKENQGIILELQAAPYKEEDNGILESYLVKIRRDGVAKHADMKQRLDQLAENNTVVVTLIKAYSPQARTLAFTTESDRFRNYAAAWRDRWNSVMEIFMAGGNYPVAGVPYPDDFPAAVQAEIAAAR